MLTDRNIKNCRGQLKRPEDVLSFDLLLKLANEEITDPWEKLKLEACINNSPLYQNAQEGLHEFIENEGIDSLKELLENELQDQFDELMLTIIDQDQF